MTLKQWFQFEVGLGVSKHLLGVSQVQPGLRTIVLWSLKPIRKRSFT